MADRDEKLNREIEALKTLRDELRVQMNLAGKEARDAFEAAEKTWRKLEGRMRLAGRETRAELEELRAAARPLAEELRHAYTKIRGLI
jgi:SMC interacting uncharacterized protein involved in chromosome segregation